MHPSLPARVGPITIRFPHDLWACPSAKAGAVPVTPRTWHGNAGVALNPRLIGLIDRRYDAILKAGFEYHEALLPLIPTAVKAKRRSVHRAGPVTIC